MSDITTLAAKLEATEQHAERGWQEAHEQEARAEAAEKKVAFLKDRLSQLANFNPDWDMLEAATESLREHMAELKSAHAKIAELEASHNKLHEGMAAIYNAICADGASTSLSAILTFVKRAFEESKSAAGIKLQIEE